MSLDFESKLSQTLTGCEEPVGSVPLPSGRTSSRTLVSVLPVHKGVEPIDQLDHHSQQKAFGVITPPQRVTPSHGVIPLPEIIEPITSEISHRRFVTKPHQPFPNCLERIHWFTALEAVAVFRFLHDIPSPSLAPARFFFPTASNEK
jgi:hypothetical protein